MEQKRSALMCEELEQISFAEWLIALNAYAANAGYNGQPLTLITGQLCWHSFYEAGVPPSVALEAAATEGRKFGSDYEDI